MKNTKQPAFPVNASIPMHEGLTKREYLAGLAMQGICANPTTDIKPHGEAIAIIAVECADALLKELSE